MYDIVIRQTENQTFPRSEFRISGCNYLNVIVFRSYFARPGGHHIPTSIGIASRTATKNERTR